MGRFRFWVKTTLYLAILSLIFPQAAYAYLDAGSGSYIIQLLMGAFLAMLFAVKIYWRNLKELLAGRFSKNKKELSEENAEDNA